LAHQHDRFISGGRTARKRERTARARNHGPACQRWLHQQALSLMIVVDPVKPRHADQRIPSAHAMANA
jgi:hypothetical protein